MNSMMCWRGLKQQRSGDACNGWRDERDYKGVLSSTTAAPRWRTRRFTMNDRYEPSASDWGTLLPMTLEIKVDGPLKRRIEDLEKEIANTLLNSSYRKR